MYNPIVKQKINQREKEKNSLGTGQRKFVPMKARGRNFFMSNELLHFPFLKMNT